MGFNSGFKGLMSWISHTCHMPWTHLCYYLIHKHRYVYTETSNHFEFITTQKYSAITNSASTAPPFILHYSLVEPLSSNFSFLLHSLFSLLSFIYSSFTIVFPRYLPIFFFTSLIIRSSIYLFRTFFFPSVSILFPSNYFVIS